jgi:GNAT superfamily N-acetyltransferase
MTLQMLIRDVRESDFAKWKPLWDGYNAFYGRQGASALPEETTNLTWSRFFDGYEPIRALVAERDEKLVGLVHYLYHRSSTQLRSNCYLQDLFTVESARGQGIGRALIEEVYRRAAQAGSGRVYWQTQETNDTAMKLYDKVAAKSGFIIYSKDFDPGGMDDRTKP